MPKEQHIEIPLAGQLDTNTAERAVEAPNLLVAENVDRSEPGRLKKRKGFKALPTLGTANPQFLHEHAGGLYAVASGQFHIRSLNSGAWETQQPGFFNLGPQDPPRTLVEPLPNADDAGVGELSTDVAYGSGLVAVTGIRRTDRLHLTVSEEASGAVIFRGELASSGVVAARPVVLDTVIVVVYTLTTGAMTGIVLPIATLTNPLTWGTFTIKAAAAITSTDKMDAVKRASGTDRVILVFHEGANVVTADYSVSASTGFSLNGQVTLAVGGVLRCVGVTSFVSTNTNPIMGVTVFGDSVNGVRVHLWDAGMAATRVLTVNASVTEAYNVSVCQGTGSAADRVSCFYDDISGVLPVEASVTRAREFTADTATGALTIVSQTVYGVVLASKAFHQTGKPFIVLSYTSTNGHGGQKGTYLYVGVSQDLVSGTEIDQFFPVGHFLKFNSYGFPEKASKIPSVARVDSGVFVTVQDFLLRTTGSGSVSSQKATSKITFDFRPEARHMASSYAGAAIAAASIPYSSGWGSVQDGYLHAPSLEPPGQLAGGFLTALATYTYQVVYEYVDKWGNLHWSVPSIAQSVTLTGGNQTVQLTYYHPLINLARVLVFRSLANDASVLYLVASLTQAWTTGTQFYNDGTSDTAIQGNEIIYTNGGAQLARYMPPPHAFSCVHDERLWVISDDDGSLWYSQRRVYPEAPAFSPALVIDDAGEGGRPVAIASLSDTRLAVLWENRIAIVSGSGPNVAGVGGTYSAPLPVPAPAGTSEPKSVLGTHLGVVFRNDIGYHILDLNGQVQYISQAVADYEGDTCVSAVQLAQQHEIAFVTVSGSDTRVLYWDYVEGQWTTQLIAGKTAISARAYQGLLTILFTDGSVWQQADDATYDHAGTFAPMRVETAWIKPGGKLGENYVQSLFLLLEKLGTSDFRVELAYDYGSAYSERADFTSVELGGVTQTEEGLMLEVLPASSRAVAFKLKLEERQSGGVVNTSGVAIDALRALLAPVAGEHREIHAALRKGAGAI